MSLVPENEQPTDTPVCRHWKRLQGFCRMGDSCQFAHPPMFGVGLESGVQSVGATVKNMREAWLKSKDSGKGISPNDAPSKWKSRGRNGNRAPRLSEWILDKFDLSRLQGQGVVDIAGGGGELAFHLQSIHCIPCVVVDPRPMTLKRHLKRYIRHEIGKLRRKQKREAASVVATCNDQDAKEKEELAVNMSEEKEQPYPPIGLPTQIQTEFPCFEPSNAVADAGGPLREALEKCYFVVGLHADQPTEAIVDYCLQHKKPFAVVSGRD